jgi:quercetin dioxygenase-like cupin family protein
MLRRLLTVCLVLFSWAAYPVFGQVDSPKATIIDSNSAITRSVPSGKASIKILAEGKNAFIGQLSLAPGAKVPLHRDPTEEYLYIVAGGGLLSIDGQTTKITAGMTVYMPANALVTFQNGDKMLIALQVFAGPESAKKYEKWPLNTDKKK